MVSWQGEGAAAPMSTAGRILIGEGLAHFLNRPIFLAILLPDDRPYQDQARHRRSDADHAQNVVRHRQRSP
jgi:hypothetical protein